MISYMDVRCKEILSLIFFSPDCVSMEQLEKEMNLSKRSVYYEICKINEWMEQNGFPELKVMRGKGYYIEEAVKTRIEAMLDKKQSKEIYIFSPKERVYIIICYIIYSKRPVYINELMDCCKVSRNTIFSDLKVVVSLLQEYRLQLGYKSKEGYTIEGDAIRVRAIFFYYFNQLLPLYESENLEFISKKRIKEYLQKLKAIEKELKINYVDDSLVSIAALIPILERNNQKLHFADIKKQEVMDTKEFRLIQKYFPELIEEEKIYLCLHLLGSRTMDVSEDFMYNRSNQTVYEITKALVDEFEKVACVIYENREELERALFVHISASLYRYEYGIQVGNPLLEDVQREYPNLFDITKIVCNYMESQVGLPISDGEIAYLALHFGGHLQISKKRNSRLRVLIVCATGISTGNMLKREIIKLIPYVELVGVIAASDAVNVQNVCDLVISTVRLKCLVPVVVVHPIMTDADRDNVLNHLQMRGYHKPNVRKLFNVIKKYVKDEDYRLLQKELDDFFEKENHINPFGDETRQPGFIELLEPYKIRFFDEKYVWERAIRASGKCLVDNGSISETYLENIISNVRHYGPYMFITEDVVLAHAKPEEGVNQMDISVGIFRESVMFSRGRAAKMIIVLAPEDQEKHLKVLKDIMKLFSDSSVTEALAGMASSGRVLLYLEDIMKKEK